MRRFLATLLAFVICAIAPVPAWVSHEAPNTKCCCCDGDGSCGMPDCVPPPAPAQPVPASIQVARIAASTATRVAAPVRRDLKFYAAVAAEPAQPALVRVPAMVASTASASLYKVHCSFLI
ncbi:MAG: hypothetical protein JSR48_06755 [Verrucomicrobia bacterium]|nr:hypothetical protein [Verrucomicrobiota bacterium]